jgi:hypothetical protein
MVTKPLSETGIKKQVGRLRAFANYEALRDELVRCLWTHAHSDEHAARVIDQLVDTRVPNESGYTACPTPAVIITACKAINPTKPKASTADKKCSASFGSGFAQDYILATRHGDRLDTEQISQRQAQELRKQPLSTTNQALYEGVHPCACVQPAKELVDA